MRYGMTLSVVAAAACLTGCRSSTVSGVVIEKELRNFIPADTKVLAGIELNQLKTTPLYRRHQKDLNLAFIEDLSTRIGVDPRRDISQVLVAWNGKRALFLVRGTFKQGEVEPKLTSLGAHRSTYKNHQVFGDGNHSLAFVNQGFAIEGLAGDVEKALDLEGSGGDAVPEELQARLRQVPKADQIWIAGRGGLPFADIDMRSDVESALSNIVNFITGATMGARADTGLHFQLDLTCVSEQGARRVHDALRGAIGLGRLSTKDKQRELLQVYDAINVDQDQTMVHVHADYSGELTDKLFEELGRIGTAKKR